MAAGRYGGSGAGFSREHQGAADDAGGRGDTVVERGAAADFGFVCVRAAGAVLQGSSLPCERTGKDGCGDFPGEYGGRVHRDRVEERVGGSEEAAGVFESRDAEGWEETDPVGFGRGNQADFAIRDEAAGAASDSVRAGAQAAEHDDRTQGKYSEVYRGGIPGLGVRTGAGRVSRTNGDGTGELDPGQPGQESRADGGTECGADRAGAGAGHGGIQENGVCGSA